LFELFNVVKFRFFFVSAQIRINFSKGFSKSGIKVILDIVVCATGQGRGNISPFISQLILHIKQDVFFFLTPFLIFADNGVKLIMPSKY
jgi:hypothetical protein